MKLGEDSPHLLPLIEPAPCALQIKQDHTWVSVNEPASKHNLKHESMPSLTETSDANPNTALSHATDGALKGLQHR